MARDLALPVNAPVAEVRRLFVAPPDTVLHVAEACYRGNYIHFEMDFLQPRTSR